MESWSALVWIMLVADGIVATMDCTGSRCGWRPEAGSII